jgi:hypothetical protein
MLPPVSPTGEYKPWEIDLVRGFLVLSHAEIEHYLEDVAVEAASKSLATWSARGRVNRCLAALMLGYDKDKTPKPQTMNAHFQVAVKNYISYARKNNHGIKEKNVIDLFSQLGVDRVELDTALLAELDSLGSARGQVAHTSGRKVRNPPDRLLIEQQVSKAISELSSLDALVRSVITR